MWNVRRFATACLAAFALVACRTPPTSPASQTPLAQIQEWEDRRSLGGGQLLAMCRPPYEPDVRVRALWALGRIQDPATIEEVAGALADPDARVREAAAFAAGLLGLSWQPLPEERKAALVTPLLAAEQAERDEAVQRMQLWALSTVPTPAALERLSARLRSPQAPVAAAAALSLGVAVRRDGKLFAPERVPDLAALAQSPNDEGLRYAGTYALSTGKSPAAREPLLARLRDPSAEVRAIAVKGLSETAREEDLPAVAALLGDPDYRVAVEAVRALAKAVERCPADRCPALDRIAPLVAHVDKLAAGPAPGSNQLLLAFAQLPTPARARELLAQVRARIAAAFPRAPEPQKVDLAKLDCRYAASLDRLAGEVKEALSCGRGLVPEPRRLALALTEVAAGPAVALPGHADPLAVYLSHANGTVRSAAMGALGASKAPTAAERIRPFISNPDLLTAATAAAVAGDLQDRAAIPAIQALAARVPELPEIAESIGGALAELKAQEAVPALQGWLAVPHAHVRHSGAKALGQLMGSPVLAPRVELPPRALGPQAPPGSTVKLVTEQGEIVIRLDAERTPLTAGNFYGLAKKGFYDGLTFHRIVPDFVVQGGDPRGDGEGGPGYTFRCEVSPRRYVRGTVGMALSGKDTGGSQFFISTSPQPHLDGRYTAFGEVLSGIEVADRLLEGDRILRAEVSP